MNQTQALRTLYQRHLHKIGGFVKTFPNDGLEGPLLMQPSAYFDQSTKLFIVGQETNGWHCEYDDIDAQLAVYAKFNMGESYRSSPFWNVTRKVEAILRIAPHSCAWSNLNRFDQAGGAPHGAILQAMSGLDFLVREEIRILRPDVCLVCLFYTNRKFDHRIAALYPDVAFHDLIGLPQSHFVRLTHSELPQFTFRTPHPRTIRTRKWEDAFLNFVRQYSTARLTAA
jgi:hypothetical protein